MDPTEILPAYFDTAHFWRDVDHVMGLTITEMRVYHRQAARIAKQRQA